jgi:SAM-dependent methyltransferase
MREAGNPPGHRPAAPMSRVPPAAPCPRACAVCGSLASEVLYRQTFAQVEGVSFVAGYDVVACDGCGFAFASGIPAQEDFDRYYERQSKYEKKLGGISRAERLALECDYGFLARFAIDKAAKILEIGCGAGNFLLHLKERGYDNLHALEPAPGCVSHLREAGISAVAGAASQPMSETTCDAVVLLTVLEHVVELNSTVENMSRMLRHGGYLYLRVPDAEKFDQYEDSPFQQFSPEHINYFSVTSASNLMGKHGYRLLESESVAMLETDNSLLPMLHLMFKKDVEGGERGWVRDLSVKSSLRRYIYASSKREEKVHGTIEGLAAAGDPIVVWGVGTHTLRLLENGPLGRCNIIAFIDSNPHYVGGVFKGIPVCSPADLGKYPNKILVSSRVYQNEIANHIRNTLKAPNELVLLY